MAMCQLSTYFVKNNGWDVLLYKQTNADENITFFSHNTETSFMFVKKSDSLQVSAMPVLNCRQCRFCSNIDELQD